MLSHTVTGTMSLSWRYVKASIKRKIAARELTDDLIERALSAPDSVARGRKGRLVAQRKHPKAGFGNLLIRMVYDEICDEKVVVSAYWARPERYERGERF